jgi:hypothetical protein
MPLFGLHTIKKAEQDATICITESRKTAVIINIIFHK